MLLEIERLWGMMPHLYDCISSQASAQEHLPAKFLRSRSVPNSLDKANFALCDIALKLLTVELDQLLEKLPVTASSQTNVLTAKRKTENFTSANTSVIPLDRDKVSYSIIYSLHCMLYFTDNDLCDYLEARKIDVAICARITSIHCQQKQHALF